MTDLLTRDEYAAIAAGLDIPAAPFIDGRFRPGTGDPLPVLNPATGAEITRIAAAGGAETDLAVDRARQAFAGGDWSRRHPTARKQTLLRLGRLLHRHRRRLAVLECIDSGKPIRDCEHIDIPEAIAAIRWHAEAIDKIYDQAGPAGDGAISWIVREPVGVVAAILPWNFPLLMLAWKIGPALAAGCSVLVKPAEQTPLTALVVGELAREAGIPPGVLQILPGTGPVVGDALARHGDVDMVSFTGSTDTGRSVLRAAADSNLKQVVLECGGKNPAVVLRDAENLDHVAGQLLPAAFWNMGQNCSAASRLIVHREVRAPLVERLLARLREWRTGDPLDPAHHLGALIDPAHCRRVRGFLTGRILAGGPGEGPFVPPTLIEVEPGDRRAREEIFGPVLCLIEVASDAEAIALANDTPYGLTASVFSAGARNALRAAREIRAGTVTINCHGEGDISTPFGGFRQSGFGGRDNGLHAHDQYTEVKTIWLDLADPADTDAIG